jgi:hypothetical protein
MNKAKIHLSKQEMQLVTNADWILTKNGIIKKVQSMFGNIEQEMTAVLQQHAEQLPADIIHIHSKISKGENYEGLPYIILDCPRYFKGENIFAIRTMFWWGNFFSITLHLSGIYKNEFENKFIESFDGLKKEKLFFCHNANQWEHHFGKTNYTPVSKLSVNRLRKLITKNSFIKLAQKIPLKKWDKADKILIDHFKRIIKILID